MAPFSRNFASALPRLGLVLSLAASLSACSSRPQQGIFSGPALSAGEPEKQVVALPVPGTPAEKPVPVPSEAPPAPAPTSVPSAKPSPVPSPAPLPVGGSIWPKGKPSPAPSTKPKPNTRPVTVPSKPAQPSTSAEIPQPSPLFTLFMRPFAQAMGLYSHGSLANADELPSEGGGFVKLFRARDRAYGTLDLTTLIAEVSKSLRQEIPHSERLQIGDLSAHHGGSGSGHASHQNGLDVDIAILKNDHREMDPNNIRLNKTGFDESFVDKKGNVTPNFDVEGNWKLVQILTSTSRVDRIFIDQNLKRRFCDYAEEKGMRKEWEESLRKLRHWANHTDHMHVRMTCPANSKDCKMMAPVPAGDGCDPLLKHRSGSAGFISLDYEPENLDPDPNETGC